MGINNKKGFTLIEVVLVLAIGGLIILMALVVFPNAMKSLRDTQRQEDYTQLSTAISRYSSSNNGKIVRLLGSGGSLKTGVTCGEKTLDPANYINTSGEDPNGYPYNLYVCNFVGWNGQGKPAPTTSEDSESGHTDVYVVLGADCEGVNDAGYSEPGQNNSTKAYAIFGALETGSGTYCSSNLTQTNTDDSDS